LECFIKLCIPDILFVFLQKISDGFGDLKEVQDEPSIITHQSEGTADLMHNPWRLPI
jgi:hypothetical protein